MRYSPSEFVAPCMVAGCTDMDRKVRPGPSLKPHSSHQRQQEPPRNCCFVRTRTFAYWKGTAQTSVAEGMQNMFAVR